MELLRNGGDARRVGILCVCLAQCPDPVPEDIRAKYNFPAGARFSHLGSLLKERAALERMVEQTPQHRTPATAQQPTRKLTKAEAFLREQLKKGPKSRADLMSEAGRAGISPYALKQAGRNGDVRKMPTGFRGAWLWTLAQS